VQFASGALHFTGNVAEEFRLLCDLALLGVMAFGLYIVAKGPRGDVPHLFAAMLGTLCLALVASPVLSPQFIVWIVPFGVAVVATRGGREIPLLLVGITATTLAIYPFLYAELAAAEAFPLILLWGRNLALIRLGLLTLRLPWKITRGSHAREA
jgi:hypothetical protein